MWSQEKQSLFGHEKDAKQIPAWYTAIPERLKNAQDFHEAFDLL